MPQVDQLTVNEYTPGVGISPHIDTHSSFTGAILSLSLVGSCVMVFRRACKAAGAETAAADSAGGDNTADTQGLDTSSTQQQQVCVYLPPRSLLVMGGEARYAWWVALRGDNGCVVRGLSAEHAVAVVLQCMLAPAGLQDSARAFAAAWYGWAVMQRESQASAHSSFPEPRVALTPVHNSC